MAMDFGKVNRSVAFNPTSAFPLDARIYFESYEDALLAAASAEEVGGTNSQYYIGQILSVVENGKVNIYKIQSNKTLELLEKNIEIDENLFKYDNNGKLTIVGVDSAAPGTQPIKNADGSIGWIERLNAYDKSEVYTKSETEAKIAEGVAAANHLKRKIVAGLEVIDKFASDAEQYIYMVPALEGLANDVYDEYIVIDGEIEKVGSWEVDLSDYAKAVDLDNKVDKVEGARLITDVEGEKLAKVNADAEVNVIASVSGDDFELLERHLSLRPISIGKVSGLQAKLDDLTTKKVDKIEGWTLLSPTDQAKLAKLAIDVESEDIVISGTVNIENVQGLEDWLNANAGTTPGLSENNLTNDLYNKLIDQLFIKSVNESQLEVSSEGELSINAVDYSQVTGLNDLLALKAEAAVVEAVSSKVSALETSLNDFQDRASNKFMEIDNRLTWHSLQ